MKEIIAYFWENAGFQYDPTRQYMFSWYHIIMMLLMIIIFLVFWQIGRSKKLQEKGRLLKIIALILFVLETLRVLNYRYVFEYTWFNSISFHMCSIAVYLSIITGIFQKRWMFDYLMPMAFIGAPLAIIIPMGILPYGNDFSFMPLQSNVSHLLVTFFIIYALKLKLWGFKVKRSPIAILSIIIMTFSLHLINIYKHDVLQSGHSNYFWTRKPDPLFPIINTWEFPDHLIVLVSLFILTTFMIYLIGEKITKLKSK